MSKRHYKNTVTPQSRVSFKGNKPYESFNKPQKEKPTQLEGQVLFLYRKQNPVFGSKQPMEGEAFLQAGKDFLTQEITWAGTKSAVANVASRAYNGVRNAARKARDVTRYAPTVSESLSDLAQGTKNLARSLTPTRLVEAYRNARSDAARFGKELYQAVQETELPFRRALAGALGTAAVVAPMAAQGADYKVADVEHPEVTEVGDKKGKWFYHSATGKAPLEFNDANLERIVKHIVASYKDVLKRELDAVPKHVKAGLNAETLDQDTVCPDHQGKLYTYQLLKKHGKQAGIRFNTDGWIFLYLNDVTEAIEDGRLTPKKFEGKTNKYEIGETIIRDRDSRARVLDPRVVGHFKEDVPEREIKIPTPKDPKDPDLGKRTRDRRKHTPYRNRVTAGARYGVLHLSQDVDGKEYDTTSMNLQLRADLLGGLDFKDISVLAYGNGSYGFMPFDDSDAMSQGAFGLGVFVPAGKWDLAATAGARFGRAQNSRVFGDLETEVSTSFTGYDAEAFVTHSNKWVPYAILRFSGASGDTSGTANLDRSFLTGSSATLDKGVSGTTQNHAFGLELSEDIALNDARTWGLIVGYLGDWYNRQTSFETETNGSPDITRVSGSKHGGHLRLRMPFGMLTLRAQFVKEDTDFRHNAPGTNISPRTGVEAGAWLDLGKF